MKNPIMVFIIFIVLILFSILIKKYNTIQENYINEIPIIIYYHIAEIGEWEKIVIEQLNLIESSGLYKICKEIRIGFLGNKNNVLKFIHDKVKLVYHSENLKEYEHPTLNSLLYFSKQCKRVNYILYIHNKGSTNRLCNKINGQYYWRQLMNYWMIEQYKKCIHHLNNGFLTCGINKNPHNTHYSGNFWWATTIYISQLSRILNYNDRLYSENWLLTKKYKNKNISIHGPYVKSVNCDGLYGMKLLRKDYLNDDIRLF